MAGAAYFQLRRASWSPLRPWLCSSHRAVWDQHHRCPSMLPLSGSGGGPPPPSRFGPGHLVSLVGSSSHCVVSTAPIWAWLGTWLRLLHIRLRPEQTPCCCVPPVVAALAGLRWLSHHALSAQAPGAMGLLSGSHSIGNTRYCCGTRQLDGRTARWALAQTCSLSASLGTVITAEEPQLPCTRGWPGPSSEHPRTHSEPSTVENHMPCCFVVAPSLSLGCQSSRGGPPRRAVHQAGGLGWGQVWRASSSVIGLPSLRTRGSTGVPHRRAGRTGVDPAAGCLGWAAVLEATSVAASLLWTLNAQTNRLAGISSTLTCIPLG